MDARERATWRSFPLFGTLDDVVLDDLAAGARTRTWSAGEVIFRRGEAGAFMVALTEGRVKLLLLSAGGRELLLRYAEPGDLLGEIACLDGAERSADAIAVTTVSGLVVSKQVFQQVARAHPALNEAAIVHLASIIRSTNDRLESIALYHLQARLARFLLFSLQQRHGNKLEPFPQLSLGLSQADLGLLLGASRPKVNRLLQDFREHGVLVQSGTSWKCDVAALRQLAEDQP